MSTRKHFLVSNDLLIHLILHPNYIPRTDFFLVFIPIYSLCFSLTHGNIFCKWTPLGRMQMGILLFSFLFIPYFLFNLYILINTADNEPCWWCCYISLEQSMEWLYGYYCILLCRTTKSCPEEELYFLIFYHDKINHC